MMESTQMCPEVSQFCLNQTTLELFKSFQQNVLLRFKFAFKLNHWNLIKWRNHNIVTYVTMTLQCSLELSLPNLKFSLATKCSVPRRSDISVHYFFVSDSTLKSSRWEDSVKSRKPTRTGQAPLCSLPTVSSLQSKPGLISQTPCHLVITLIR